MSFEIFDRLLKKSNIKLPDKYFLIAPTDPSFIDLYVNYGISEKSLSDYPFINEILKNHVGVKLNREFITTLSNLEIIHANDKIGDYNILQFKFINDIHYFLIDDIIMTIDQLNEFNSWVENSRNSRVIRTVYHKKQSPSDKKSNNIELQDQYSIDNHISAIKSLKLNPESPLTISKKGWGNLYPKKGTERHELKHKCGDACFLRPSDEGFPICPKLTETDGNCFVDCRGLAAAKNRGRYLNSEMREIIPELQEHFGCSK